MYRYFSKCLKPKPYFQQFAQAFGTMHSNYSQMIFVTINILVLAASIHAIDLTRLYNQHHHDHQIIKTEWGIIIN